MSTEHQQYPLVGQDSTIKSYAEAHGFTVVRTYSDGARSGLILKNRAGLRQLLEDVVGNDRQFATILVYDVSRWGRFQDIDEAAHYEFICRSAGVPVHYCAEPFVNDNDVCNVVMKSLKRMMAGEYSRELSVKVLEGAKRLATLGFKQGGSPGYGYRRRLMSPSGQCKERLLPGQRKSIQEDRVILELGPEQELYWLREIFRMFTQEEKGPLAIATDLNERGASYVGVKRHKWYAQAVSRILKNPKYIGSNVYGRSSRRLGSPKITLPPSMWTIAQNCWPAIVDSATFESAQRKFTDQTRFKSDQELIAGLADLLGKTGKLTERLVMRETNFPSQAAYRRRFGSMSQAFSLAGYDKARVRAIKTRWQLRTLRERLLNNIAACNGSISISRPNGHFRPSVLLRNQVPLSVHLGPCFRTEHGEMRWLINPVRQEREFITLIARLNVNNDDFHDYVVLPNLGTRKRWTMKPDDEGLKDAKRFTPLSELTTAVNDVLQTRKGGISSLRSISTTSLNMD
jgi:DNA invertase Pin-like site-specific DNA recombinase